jgi:branched-chain amino acid transport system substrate-binding protein
MRRVLVVIVAVAAVAAGCSGSGSKGPVRIGALYPRSGTQGVGGTEEERGVALAVEWANAHGGVHGRRVRLESVDASRAEAVPDALVSLRRKGVSVVLGSHGSSISAVAASLAGRENLSFWETGAVGEVGPASVGGRSFFRLAPMGANLGMAAIDFVRQELAPKLAAGRALRYVVAHVDDPYGRAVGQGAASEVGRTGDTLVGTFPYDAHTADFAPLAAQIAAVHPDVLFVAAYLDDGVALRREMVAAHVPLVASIGTSSSYCHPAFGQALGPEAVGLFASDKPDAADVRLDALRPEGRQALTWVRGRYTARYHEEMSAPALSGFSGAYALLVHVLPAARDLSEASVAGAAGRVKLVEGTLANGGGLDFAPAGAPDAGENRAAAGVIWEWVAPGQRAVVWPPAFATHPIAMLPLAR